jgi:thiol:disulfide interchange protein
MTLAIAPACDCGDATSGDPGAKSAEAAIAPPADKAAAQPHASVDKPGAASPIASPSDSTAPVAPVATSSPALAAKVEAPKEIVWLKGTLEEALEQAKKQDKLVFIDFWTTWCGWCKKLDHDTYTDPKVIAELNEHYVCLSVDAESKIGAPLAKRYSVSGYPTLLFLTTDGLVRERVAGYKPPESFLPIAVYAARPH